MKPFAYCTALLASPIATVALQLDERDATTSAGPKVISLDIRRQRDAAQTRSLTRRHWAKRQKVTEQYIQNVVEFYYANISLGTPAQSLQLMVDTGSAELWANVPNSTHCSSASDPCGSNGGTYDPSKSSTVRVVDTNFSMEYIDGQGATGSHLSDNLAIGQVEITDFHYGVGYESNSDAGVLGVGYPATEEYGDTHSPNPTLPYALVNAGVINTPAYSLWLNDLADDYGTILFGGVNGEKYYDPLISVPNFQNGDTWHQFYVNLTGVAVNNQAISSSGLPVPAILDSGTTIMMLPDSVTQPIFDRLNVMYQPWSNNAWIPCDTDKNLQITYTISSEIIINVTMSELVQYGTNQEGPNSPWPDGRAGCDFMMVPSEHTFILGDSFLRSAYVVYDLQHNEIGLAQARYDAELNNVVEFQQGKPMPLAWPLGTYPLRRE